MKILITNIVTLNAGDAAILYGMIDLLRAAFGKDTQFIVYDKHGELPGRYYPQILFRKLLYLTRQANWTNSATHRGLLHKLLLILDHGRFKIGRWSIKHHVPLISQILLSRTERRDLLDYKTADLIVSSGGTYLVENYSLDARIFDYRIAHYFERPLVFFTQTLGPFTNTSNRRALAPIFDNSALILVRDEQSRHNLIDLGVKKENVHLAADAAFVLSDAAAVESAKLAHANPGARPFRVAISVREWRHFKTIDPVEGMNRYRQALQAVTQHLIAKHNAEVTYLSTCQGMPEYWTDDSRIAATIVDGLDANVRESVSVDSDFHDPIELTKMLQDYDVVIATRMHMAILALGAGTPVVPIAYEFKMRELFERLGQGRWVHDIETISAKTLIDSIEHFLEQLPELRPALFAAVQNERENALASGQYVKEAFDQWRQSNELIREK